MWPHTSFHIRQPFFFCLTLMWVACLSCCDPSWREAEANVVLTQQSVLEKQMCSRLKLDLSSGGREGACLLWTGESGVGDKPELVHTCCGHDNILSILDEWQPVHSCFWCTTGKDPFPLQIKSVAPVHFNRRRYTPSCLFFFLPLLFSCE